MKYFKTTGWNSISSKKKGKKKLKKKFKISFAYPDDGEEEKSLLFKNDCLFKKTYFFLKKKQSNGFLSKFIIYFISLCYTTLYRCSFLKRNIPMGCCEAPHEHGSPGHTSHRRRSGCHTRRNKTHTTRLLQKKTILFIFFPQFFFLLQINKISRISKQHRMQPPMTYGRYFFHTAQRNFKKKKIGENGVPRW